MADRQKKSEGQKYKKFIFFWRITQDLKKDETGTYKGKSIKQTVTYFTGVQENLAV